MQQEKRNTGYLQIMVVSELSDNGQPLLSWISDLIHLGDWPQINPGKEGLTIIQERRDFSYNGQPFLSWISQITVTLSPRLALPCRVLLSLYLEGWKLTNSKVIQPQTDTDKGRDKNKTCQDTRPKTKPKTKTRQAKDRQAGKETFF